MADLTLLFLNAILSIIKGVCAIFVGILLDPVGTALHIALILVFVLAIWLLWKFRDRVLILLTGDPNVHFDYLGFLARVFWFCCGDGECTRLCCGGVNIVTRLGQCLGILSIPVRISNIVVGDLPVHGRNNFYVAVECKTDPEMVTSVQEMRRPKVVHFPESLCFRLRRNPIEHRLRIAVRIQMDLGHDTLCEIFFDAARVLRFCDTREGVLRFGLRPVDEYAGAHDTPPWITLKFSFAETELQRNIDDAPDGLMTSYMFANSREVWNEEHQDGQSIGQFKTDYPLRDNCGRFVHEPSEESMREMVQVHVCIDLTYRVLSSVSLVSMCVYSILRLLAKTCYSEYKLYAKAIQGETVWSNITVPFTSDSLKRIEESCDTEAACPERAENSSEADGRTRNIRRCCPSHEQVFRMCREPPGGKPPHLIRTIVRQSFGVDIGSSVFSCTEASCHFHMLSWVQNDSLVLFMLCGLLVAGCAVKMMKNYIVQAVNDIIAVNDSSGERYRSKPSSRALRVAERGRRAGCCPERGSADQSTEEV